MPLQILCGVLIGVVAVLLFARMIDRRLRSQIATGKFTRTIPMDGASCFLMEGGNVLIWRHKTWSIFVILAATIFLFASAFIIFSVGSDKIPTNLGLGVFLIPLFGGIIFIYSKSLFAPQLFFNKKAAALEIRGISTLSSIPFSQIWDLSTEEPSGLREIILLYLGAPPARAIIRLNLNDGTRLELGSVSGSGRSKIHEIRQMILNAIGHPTRL